MTRVVISVHGIRTTGAWQKELVPFLAKRRWIPYLLDYGWLRLWKLPLPWVSGQLVEWLLDEYERVCGLEDIKRPSLIAHSFGTHIVGTALLKYPDLRLDKLILCGSLLPSDYPWTSIFKREQVNLVRNDCSRADWITLLAPIALWHAANSGREGFTHRDARLIEERFDRYRHGNYFHSGHFLECWLPFLESHAPSPAAVAQVRMLLDLVTQHASRVLAIPVVKLRSNVFLPDGRGILRMPKGLNFNMDREEEFSIGIQGGTGCTGTAFSERKPAIAIMGTDWGQHTLPQTELGKVHPNLRWIISMPIPDPEGCRCSMLGVLNVDCLDIGRSPQDLQPVLHEIGNVAALVARAIRDAV